MPIRRLSLLKQQARSIGLSIWKLGSGVGQMARIMHGPFRITENSGKSGSWPLPRHRLFYGSWKWPTEAPQHAGHAQLQDDQGHVLGRAPTRAVRGFAPGRAHPQTRPQANWRRTTGGLRRPILGLAGVELHCHCRRAVRPPKGHSHQSGGLRNPAGRGLGRDNLRGFQRICQ